MKPWGLLGSEEERPERERAMRELILAQPKTAKSLASGEWDFVFPEKRMEWLEGAFPDEPRAKLLAISKLRWFQMKKDDREKFPRKAVDFGIKKD